MTAPVLHWLCPKCGKPCTTYQTSVDRWKHIYSLCCGAKNPPLRDAR